MTYDHQIIYCDSLMARFPCKRFNVYGSSLTPHSHTVHKTSFNKTPLTTIIKHSKGTIGNIWISIFYLYWYHAHTDYILMDCRWCTCNLFSSFSWFLIVICYCSVDNVFPHHLYKCYRFFSWCSFFHCNSSKLDLSNQIFIRNLLCELLLLLIAWVKIVILIAYQTSWPYFLLTLLFFCLDREVLHSLLCWFLCLIQIYFNCTE